MKVLQITTSGMKNISKDIVITFANSTIEKGIKKINNVKGIFGFNGAGKTAFVTSVDLYRKVVLNPTYLMQNDTTKKLDKLLNYSLKAFNISIVFEFKGNTVLKHSIKIEKSRVNNLYYISHEDISLSSGRTLDDKYKNLITKDGVKLSPTEDKGIFDGSVDYLKETELNYSSIVSKVISKLTEQIKTTNDSSNYSFGEKVILALYSNVRNIDVYLSNDDNHNNFVIDKNILDEIISGAETLKQKRETWIDLYSDDVVIPKQLIDVYEKDNKRLERFIRIFKPEVKEIALDKVEEGELYHIRKIFKYDHYNVEFEFESSGIKQLVKLFTYLYRCSKGGVVFVDEIDTNINTVYFSKLVSFFKKYGEGQLIFTTHNVEAMNALKGQSRSILALGKDNNMDVWVGKGNKSPVKDYMEGFFPNSPMNVEDFDFINIFFGED